VATPTPFSDASREAATQIFRNTNVATRNAIIESIETGIPLI
jgi:hypothetical protein